MDMTNAVAVLGALSLSVERVVEMIKNVAPGLSTKYDDEKKEKYRKAAVHLLAAIVGFIISMVGLEQIELALFSRSGSIGIFGCVLLGLLSSGGSGFWNQSLAIVEEIKKAKKLEIERLKTP